MGAIPISSTKESYGKENNVAHNNYITWIMFNPTRAGVLEQTGDRQAIGGSTDRHGCRIDLPGVWPGP